MPSSDTRFRRADPRDAEVVAQIAERTFRATFAHENSASDVDALCATAYGTDIQFRELSDPNRETWVLESHGAVKGYFMLRRSVAPPGVSGTAVVEIHRFYLDQDQQGTGAGRRMMALALQRCAAMGADSIWLGVWERNRKALGFYERLGFAIVGSHVFMVGTDAQTDLLMERRVSVDQSGTGNDSTRHDAR
jgi:diamine N-acetyltransferase